MAPDAEGEEAGAEASRPAGGTEAGQAEPLKTTGGSALEIPATLSRVSFSTLTKPDSDQFHGLGPKDQLASGLLRWVLGFLALFLAGSFIHWTYMFWACSKSDCVSFASAKELTEIHFEWIRLIVKDMGMSIVTLLVGYLFGSQKS